MNFYSPCEGKIFNIEKFSDEIIASKAMGDGFGVSLSGNEIVAPFDGEVKVLYPTGHAICLESEDGLQVMIHIGIDSFSIQGMNVAHVKVGDKVYIGDKLITTNVKELIEKTGNSETAVVFLGGEQINLLKEDVEIGCLEEGIIEIK